MVLNWGHYCPLRDVCKFVEAFSEGGEGGGDAWQGMPHTTNYSATQSANHALIGI